MRHKAAANKQSYVRMREIKNRQNAEHLRLTDDIQNAGGHKEVVAGFCPPFLYYWCSVKVAVAGIPCLTPVA